MTITKWSTNEPRNQSKKEKGRQHSTTGETKQDRYKWYGKKQDTNWSNTEKTKYKKRIWIEEEGKQVGNKSLRLDVTLTKEEDKGLDEEEKK